MISAPWALLQLVSYSALWWCVFIFVAGLSACRGRLISVMAGHLIIAVMITILDVRWVEDAMTTPEWDGSPDFDFLFPIGVLLRVLLVNSLLLPVSVTVLRRARRARHVETAVRCSDQKK